MSALTTLSRSLVKPRNPQRLSSSAPHLLSASSLRFFRPSTPQQRAFSSEPTSPEIKRQKFASGTNSAAESQLKPLLKWLGFYSEESKMIRSSHLLYLAARNQARKPEFRKHFGMQDTFEAEWGPNPGINFLRHVMTQDGKSKADLHHLNRFCLESLHLWMILVRLRQEGESCKQLQQDVFDNFWDDKQKQMYSMGVQSFALNTRTRELQSIFYGIAVSFDYGLGSSDALLGAAMYRNLFAGEARAVHVNRMVAYVRREIQKLNDMDTQAFLSGQWQFDSP